MRCEEAQTLLPEAVRGELSAAAENMLRTHVQSCSVCALAQGRERRLLASLQALPVPAMPEGLAARALLRARDADQAGRQAKATRRVMRLTSLAASVLVVCGIGFMLGRGSMGGQGVQQLAVNLPLGSAQMVALKIDAPQDFAEVQFEVSLPANVALQDQPELREFAWSGQLQAGTNVLSLPLVGVRAAGGQLVARVKYGSTEKSLRIPLTVVAQG